MVLIKYITVATLGLTAGFFFAGAAPTIIHIKKDVETLQIRDSYYRKCSVDGGTQVALNTFEETWTCGQMKMFLIRRLVTVQMEEAK